MVLNGFSFDKSEGVEPFQGRLTFFLLSRPHVLSQVTNDHLRPFLAILHWNEGTLVFSQVDLLRAFFLGGGAKFDININQYCVG